MDMTWYSIAGIWTSSCVQLKRLGLAPPGSTLHIRFGSRGCLLTGHCIPFTAADEYKTACPAKRTQLRVPPAAPPDLLPSAHYLHIRLMDTYVIAMMSESGVGKSAIMRQLVMESFVGT
jgi:hypothetical protein